MRFDFVINLKTARELGGGAVGFGEQDTFRHHHNKRLDQSVSHSLR